jgi:hypothetical protein
MIAMDKTRCDRRHYRSSDVVSFRIGKNADVIYSKFNRVARIVSCDVARLLHSCRDFKLLEEHAQAYSRNQENHWLESQPFDPRSQALPATSIKLLKVFEKITLKLRQIVEMDQDRNDVIQQLRELADSGFLISDAELVKSSAQLSETPPPDQRISSVGIVTCNRQESLRRCLTSYIENVKTFERTVEFVVVDDSQSTTSRRQTRQMLSLLKDQYHVNISYSGAEEKLLFANELSRCGDIPPDVANFALFDVEQCGFSAGANRNTLLLHTGGDLTLSVDDDTLCQVGATDQTTNGVAFDSRLEPTDKWFFPTREAALNSVVKVGNDILAVHEELLGKSPGSIISQSAGTPDLSAIDSSFLHGFRSTQSRVLATMMGVVGDSGISFPNRLLWLKGQPRDQLLQSPSAYTSACTSRETLRVVKRATVSNSVFCMTTVIGLDNRTPLPPFMPVQRSQDGLFGACLRRCYDYGYFGYVPWVIAHEPPDKRSHGPDEVWANTGLRLCHLVGLLVLSFGTPHNDSRNRISNLGSYLVDFGSMDLPEFVEIIRIQYWRNISERIDMLDRLLNSYGSSPRYWAEDVHKYMDALRQSASSQEGFIPTDILSGRTPEEALRLTQRLVLRFGQLLYWWPRLVEAAQALRSQNRRPATPV